MKVVAIGNSCVGKTTVVNSIAALLDVPVFDVDKWTADQYKYNAPFRHWLKSEFRSDEKAKIVELIQRYPQYVSKIMQRLEAPFKNAINHFLSTHDRCIIDMAQALESPNFNELFGDMIVINFHASEDDRKVMAEMRGVDPEKLAMYNVHQFSPEMKKLLADYTVVNRPYVHTAYRDVTTILTEVETIFKMYARLHRPEWIFENPAEVNNIKRMFFKVVAQYHKNNMPYHNMDHVMSMLKLTQDRVLFIAVLIHDMIYDPRSSTNEEDTAKAAMELLLQHSPFTLDQRRGVAELIMATKHGDEGNGYRSLTGHLRSKIVDLDLSIFFASKEEVLEYDRAIKEEYKDVYLRIEGLKKRIEILKMFLNRPVIYRNHLGGVLKETLDKTAKENLQMLIELNQKELADMPTSPSVTTRET